MLYSRNTGVNGCIPTVQVKIAGNLYTALYQSGSGTRYHTYSLSVPAGINDTDGPEVMSPLTATNGCLYDSTTPAQNPSYLTFKNTILTNVYIDQLGPLLTTFAIQPTSTITENQKLYIKANFDEKTYKVGASTFTFQLGGQNRTATYSSGSGTTQLTYEYTITSSDLALSGVVITPLPPNLQDQTGNPARGPQNTLSTPLTIYRFNSAPVAANFAPAAFGEDLSSTITLSYSDAEGDNATSCVVSNLSNVTITQACSCTGGACTVGVQGTSNYYGSGSFQFTVSSDGLTSNLATASLTILSVDDAPVVANTPGTALTEDVAAIISLPYTDVENHKATACTITTASNLLYDPNACTCDGSGNCSISVSGTSNYSGPASISYTVTANGLTSSAGTRSFTINGFDDPPVANALSPAAFDEDIESTINLTYSDPEGHLATTCATSSLSYITVTQACTCVVGSCSVKVKGTSNYNGAGSFNYTVTANGKTSNSALASLTIDPVDDAPVATNITPAAFNEDTQSLIILSYTDVELDQAASCTLTSTTNVTETQACACTSGVCIVGVTGDANYYGAASFSYKVTANGAQSNTATASFSIIDVADPVSAGNSSIVASGPVLANGIASSTVTITLKDTTNAAVVGVVPTFSADGSNNTYTACSPTSVLGISTCTMKSTTAELKTLSIDTPVVKSGGTVTFNSGSAAAATSTITGTGPVTADGTSTSSITITLKDVNGNGRWNFDFLDYDYT